MMQKQDARVLLSTMVMALSLTGCGTTGWFAPQSKLAAICTDLKSQNAGITCVNAAYAILKDTGTAVQERYLAGRMSGEMRENYRIKLNRMYSDVELAERMVLLGNLSGAQGQIDVVISVLESVEEQVIGEVK